MRVVSTPELVDDDRRRPAVEEQVVARPDHFGTARPRPNERDAHDRRFRDVEPPRSIFGQDRVQPLTLRGRVEPRQVHLADDGRDAAPDDQAGVALGRRVHARPQRRMPIDRIRPERLTF